MKTKKLEVIFIITGILLGIATMFSLVSCAAWQDLDSTQVIDAQGNVVYTPPGEVQKIVQIPGTGNPKVDAIAASVAAAVYGALGFWIRRVKKNGSAATDKLTTRLDQIECKTASMPMPVPATTTQISMADLVDLLHQLNGQKSGPPPADGTSQ